MKKYFLLMLLTFFASSWFYSNTTAASNTKSIDKIKVIVNDDVITQSEYAEKAQQFKQQLLMMHQPIPKESELSKTILENIIYTTLQMQVAKNANIEISAADVDATINNIAKKNNITIDKLKEELKQEHLDYANFRKHIQNEMLLNRIQEQFVSNDIKVSEEEVAAFLKKHPTIPGQQSTNPVYNLKDMLISLADTVTSSQKERIKSRITELTSKTNNELKKIATHFSKEHAVRIIELGWRRIEDLPSIFVPAMKNNIKAGDFIGPIEAPNGIHLLQAVQVRGAVEEIKLTNQQAKEILWRKKMAEKVKEWLEKLRSKAYIKIIE